MYGHPVAGSMYTFFTGGLKEDQRVQFLASHPYLIFQIQACSDANIYLHTDPEKPEEANYEIHIGEHENSQTTILKDGVRQTSVTTEDVLDCNSYREFWIMWFLGHILVGKGSVLNEQIITIYKDEGTPYDVIAITLATTGTSNAQWQIPRNAGTPFS